MNIIKKIDVFILKKFMMLFIGAFMVCLFVLMMNFVWRWMDELTSKGLSIFVIAKFLYQAALTLIPTALPLTILLTSLITFCNMGEQLELTAMKAAGIPLRRIIQPVFILCVALMGLSYVFQERVSNEAYKDLLRMSLSMKESSPALEIPEGVFYNGIPNINIYVKTKNADRGMLYDVIIYKMDKGFENAQIVVCDSAMVATTADKQFLRLDMYDGEQFENLQSSRNYAFDRSQVPYDRETFKSKKILIDFDSDFTMSDESLFGDDARVKTQKELLASVDSFKCSADSIGHSYYNIMMERYLAMSPLTKKEQSVAKSIKMNIDTVYAKMSFEDKQKAINFALSTTKSMATDLEWEQYTTSPVLREVRSHLISWHKKYALALACLIFLLIGAPLGAIIRKGGLGIPAIVAVVIFLLYHTLSFSGERMAKNDIWTIVYGVWISTFVLTPLGIFLSYKANKDSTVLNIGQLISKIKYSLGIREERNYALKEVIMEDVDYAEESRLMAEMNVECENYIKKHYLPHIPNYVYLFFMKQDDKIKEIRDKLDALIERMSNSKDPKIIEGLNHYPIMYSRAHLTPFRNRTANIILGILLPFGIFFAFRSWRFRIILYRDLKKIIRVNGLQIFLIDKMKTNKINS